MNAAEYIANFFLIIIGFAVAEILKGSARLIRERKRIKFYWPYLVLIPFAFEILIFGFLYIFTVVNGKAGQPWSTVDLAITCATIAPWAFISYLIFPSNITDGFDIKTFYFEQGRVIVLITGILTVFVLIDAIVMRNSVAVIMQVLTLVLTIFAFRYFEKMHLYYMGLMIVIVNIVVFYANPISIG